MSAASNGFLKKLTDLGAAASLGVVVMACINQLADLPSKRKFEKTMVAKLESIELMMAGKAKAAATATAEKGAAVGKQG